MAYKVLLRRGVDPARFMKDKGLVHIRTESIPYVGQKKVYGRSPGAHNRNLIVYHDGIHPLDSHMIERYPESDHSVTIFFEGSKDLHEAQQFARELKSNCGLAIISPWGDREEIYL